MGYYYNDPSGQGAWWVDDNQTPKDAFQQRITDLGIDVSPLLKYSVTYNPEASKINGGKPSGTGARNDLAVAPFRGKVVIGRPLSDEACLPGYDYNFISGGCEPTGGNPYGGGPIEGPLPPIYGQSQDVFFQAFNQINIANDGIDRVANTVSSGIQQGIDAAAQTTSDLTDAINSKIGGLTTSIENGVNSLFGGVKDGLAYLAGLIKDNVSAMVGFITDHIGKIVDTVKDVFNNVLVPVFNHIDTVLTTVTDVLNKTIIPVFQAISQTYNQTVSLIDAIKADVHNGIQGILQLPSDLANSLSSIDASIERALAQVGLKKSDGTSVFLDYTGKDSVWDRLQHIGKGVAVLGQIDKQAVTFKDFVHLSEPDLSRAGSKAIDALIGEIATLLGDLVSGGTRSIEALKSTIPIAPLLLGIETGSWIGTWELIKSLDRLFEPFYKFAEEDIAAKAGLSKLGVGDALNAWRRGIINDDDVKEDLAVRGWDSTRIRVLKDLQKYVVDIHTALDMHFRGIIDKAELTSTLAQSGVTEPQRDALIEQSAKLFDIGLAATAKRWNLIDDQALDAVLRVHRYTNEEITIFKDTLYAHETTDDVLARIRFERLYVDLGFSDTDFENVPADFLSAAARNGVDATVAKDRWQRSFYVPQISEWVALYFRGIRTRRELEAAFSYYRVPSQFRDDIIREHQSLIPWRTIPTMLANGIISEPYAKQQLQAHGFDLQATESLLRYAELTHKKVSVAASGDLHALSVSNAKQFWELGALTDLQYHDILISHGYDEASAKLTIDAESMSMHVKERKQIATDLVNEVITGLITVDQANAQMSAHEFTDVERAKVLKGIRNVKKQISKLPTEAELRKMVENNIIDMDEYSDALSTFGFSQTWIVRLVQLYFGGKNGSAIVQATS